MSKQDTNTVTVALADGYFDNQQVVACALVLTYYAIVEQKDVKFIRVNKDGMELGLEYDILLNIGLSEDPEYGHFDFRFCDGLVEEVWAYYGNRILQAYLDSDNDSDTTIDLPELHETVARKIGYSLSEFNQSVNPIIENLNSHRGGLNIAIKLVRNILDIQIQTLISNCHMKQKLESEIEEQGGSVLLLEPLPPGFLSVLRQTYNYDQLEAVVVFEKDKYIIHLLANDRIYPEGTVQTVDNFEQACDVLENLKLNPYPDYVEEDKKKKWLLAGTITAVTAGLFGWWYTKKDN